ncbi:hypothetical protein HGRIS_009343 [Hohenbuehelia grisea]|uniref:Uncharacterized protein n=1 Tax=Hohenbuehelia grisea TaxID=104357 RepID=A0ABR3J0U4_9AGAR
MFIRILFQILPILISSSYVDPPWINEEYGASMVAMRDRIEPKLLVPLVSPPASPPPSRIIGMDPPSSTILATSQFSTLFSLIGPIIALLAMVLAGYLVSKNTPAVHQETLEPMRILLAEVHGNRISSMSRPRTVSRPAPRPASRSCPRFVKLAVRRKKGFVRRCISFTGANLPWIYIATFILGAIFPAYLGHSSYHWSSPASSAAIKPVFKALTIIDLPVHPPPSSKIAFSMLNRVVKSKPGEAATTISTPTVNPMATVSPMATLSGFYSAATVTPVTSSTSLTVETPQTPTVIYSTATVTTTFTVFSTVSGTSTQTSSDAMHAATPLPLPYDVHLRNTFVERVLNPQWIDENEVQCHLDTLPNSQKNPIGVLYSHCLASHIKGEHKAIIGGPHPQFDALVDSRLNWLWLDIRTWSPCDVGSVVRSSDIEMAKTFSRCVINSFLTNHHKMYKEYIRLRAS